MGFFGQGKQEQTILDVFIYDITSFFYGEYEEVESIDTESMFMIVYERMLPWVEHDCFDAIQFRVFFDKENFTGSNPVNVRLFAKKITPEVPNIGKFVERIHKIYGPDDENNTQFTTIDEAMVTARKFSRRWTIEKGESFVTLYFNENGLELNILFLNNLIKHTGKYLNIK